MATLAPELGDVEEDEVGARFSRLENLVGNLVRAVGEQPRPQNAPVSRGECGFVVYPAGAGRCWVIIAMCFLSLSLLYVGA